MTCSMCPAFLTSAESEACGTCHGCRSGPPQMLVTAQPSAFVPKAPTSGNDGFDHFARTRFVRKEDKVVLLPDEMPGKFSNSMTAEQAEFLIAHLTELAKEARLERGRKYPGLYPEDVR